MIRSLQALKWISFAFILYVLGSIVLSILQPMKLADRIKTGMSEAEVVQAVGQAPAETNSNFPACAEKSGDWTGDCASVMRSGATKFLIWKFGVDTVLVVGIGADAKVVFSGVGDV